jgi:glycerophosphoryl diester phosphodiesterase
MKTLFFLCLLTIAQGLHAFDWQGHRGARGLYPENTIGSMQTALQYPVMTLELDVVISKDDLVVVSHEPWMNPEICLGPARERLSGKKVNLRTLTYDEIKKYDCGSLGNPRFPEQRKVSVGKPLLTDLLQSMEQELRRLGRTGVGYNIEIKSTPEDEARGFQPEYRKFSELVVATILKHIPMERFTIQSFDWRVLRYLKEKHPGLSLVALRESSFVPQKVIEELGFAPKIFSPHWKLLNAETVAFFQQQGIRVIPWTVNEVEDMRSVKALGVDGIITDYPNRILELEQKSCPAGHNLFEGRCVKIPEHARASNKNPGWVCEHGYQQKRNRCQKIIIPRNAVLLEDGKSWGCKEGYVAYRASCKRDSRKNEILLGL